jgi:hypothetical protein
MLPERTQLTECALQVRLLALTYDLGEAGTCRKKGWRTRAVPKLRGATLVSILNRVEDGMVHDRSAFL